VPEELITTELATIPKVFISGHASIQPPARFTRRTNVKLWFKAFENYVMCNHLVNKSDQLEALLDEEVQQLIERCPLSNNQEEEYNVL
jgi:hypothetical protein